MRRLIVLSRAVALFVACGVAEAAPAKIVLNAGEEPETKTWTLPASIGFTDNADAADSWALDLAGKVEGHPFGSLTHMMFARVVAQKNTQLKKAVENYVAEIGARLDFNTAGGHGPDTRAWYLRTKFSIAWADKTVFPDAKAVCTTVPLPADCVEQQEESLRASVATQFFRSSWENTFAYADRTHTKLVGPGWTHSFIPVLTVFYDELLDAKPDANGVEPDGGVLGGRAVVNLAVSPGFSDYRLILSVGLQEIYAFDRSSGRETTFARDSLLVKLSADYELGLRSFEGGAGWIPSLGVTYTKGDDPIAGKLDQDNVVVGFKVTYRSE